MATIFVDTRGQQAREEQFNKALRLQAGEAIGRGALGVAAAVHGFVEANRRKEKEDLDRIAAVSTQVGGIDHLYDASPSAFEKMEELTGVKFNRGPDGKPIIPVDEKKAYDRKFFESATVALSNPEYRDVLLGVNKPNDPTAERIADEDRKARAYEGAQNRAFARANALDAAGSRIAAAQIRANARAKRDADKPDNQPSGVFRLPNGTTTTDPRRAARRGGVELSVGVAKFWNEFQKDSSMRKKTSAEIDKIHGEAEKTARAIALLGPAEPLLGIGVEARRAGDKAFAKSVQQAVVNEMTRNLPPDSPLAKELSQNNESLFSWIYRRAIQMKQEAKADVAIQSQAEEMMTEDEKRLNDMLDAAGVGK